MAVSMKEIFQDTQKAYGLRLCAGEVGINNIIEWTQRVESMRELTGQDEAFFEHTLVITAASMLEKEEGKLFVEHLIRLGCCGLIVFGNGQDKFIKEDIISLCNTKNFPLILMADISQVGELQREYISAIENDKNVSNTLSKVFAAVLEGKAKIGNHEHLLREQGFRFDAKYTCIVLYAEEKRQYIELQKMREWNRFLTYAVRSIGVYVSFQMKQYQVIIVKDVEEKILKKIMISFTKTLNHNHVGVVTAIGIGDMVEGLENIDQSYYSAVAAARKSCMDDVPLTAFRDMGIYQLLLTVRDDEFIRGFIKRQLGPLLEYDRIHESELLETLRKYLLYNYSVNHVSEEMHLHRNTVNKRILLIKSLLPGNSFQGEDRVCLETALICFDFYKK